MATTLVSASFPQELAEKIADALLEAVLPPCDGVSAFATGSGGTWQLEAYYADTPDPGELAWALERAQLDIHLVKQFRFQVLNDTDWVKVGLADHHPVKAGRFVVIGPHDRGKVPANLHALEIEASLAFGTGHHATTWGCLQAIHDTLKYKKPRHVLDVGTGSGVLAFAVAKACHAPCVATEIDPDSVRIAQANARHNGVAREVAVLLASGTHHQVVQRSAPYDLVVANILAAPLVQLAPHLARCTGQKGTIILSGLLVGQARRVIAAYRSQGLRLKRMIKVREWATLILEK